MSLHAKTKSRNVSRACTLVWIHRFQIRPGRGADNPNTDPVGVGYCTFWVHPCPPWEERGEQLRGGKQEDLYAAVDEKDIQV